VGWKIPDVLQGVFASDILDTLEDSELMHVCAVFHGVPTEERKSLGELIERLAPSKVFNQFLVRLAALPSDKRIEISKRSDLSRLLKTKSVEDFFATLPPDTDEAKKIRAIQKFFPSLSARKKASLLSSLKKLDLSQLNRLHDKLQTDLNLVDLISLLTIDAYPTFFAHLDGIDDARGVSLDLRAVQDNLKEKERLMAELPILASDEGLRSMFLDFSTEEIGKRLSRTIENRIRSHASSVEADALITKLDLNHLPLIRLVTLYEKMTPSYIQYLVVSQESDLSFSPPEHLTDLLKIFKSLDRADFILIRDLLKKLTPEGLKTLNQKRFALAYLFLIPSYAYDSTIPVLLGTSTNMHEDLLSKKFETLRVDMDFLKDLTDDQLISICATFNRVSEKEDREAISRSLRYFKSKVTPENFSAFCTALSKIPSGDRVRVCQQLDEAKLDQIAASSPNTYQAQLMSGALMQRINNHFDERLTADQSEELTHNINLLSTQEEHSEFLELCYQFFQELQSPGLDPTTIQSMSTLTAIHGAIISRTETDPTIKMVQSLVLTAFYEIKIFNFQNLEDYCLVLLDSVHLPTSRGTAPTEHTLIPSPPSFLFIKHPQQGFLVINPVTQETRVISMDPLFAMDQEQRLAQYKAFQDAGDYRTPIDEENPYVRFALDKQEELAQTLQELRLHATPSSTLSESEQLKAGNLYLCSIEGFPVLSLLPNLTAFHPGASIPSLTIDEVANAIVDGSGTFSWLFIVGHRLAIHETSLQIQYVVAPNGEKMIQVNLTLGSETYSMYYTHQEGQSREDLVAYLVNTHRLERDLLLAKSYFYRTLS